jgi:hypothetical protein
MNQDRAGFQGERAVHERREQFVVDDDRGGGIDCLRPICRHHHSDCVAHELDLIRAQARTRRLRLESEIRGLEDADHPRHVPGRFHIHAIDASACMLRANEHSMQTAVRAHVVGESPGARDQPGVLSPLDSATQRRVHRHCGRMVAWPLDG